MIDKVKKTRMFLESFKNSMNQSNDEIKNKKFYAQDSIEDFKSEIESLINVLLQDSELREGNPILRYLKNIKSMLNSPNFSVNKVVIYAKYLRNEVENIQDRMLKDTIYKLIDTLEDFKVEL